MKVENLWGETHREMLQRYYDAGKYFYPTLEVNSPPPSRRLPTKEIVELVMTGLLKYDSFTSFITVPKNLEWFRKCIMLYSPFIAIPKTKFSEWGEEDFKKVMGEINEMTMKYDKKMLGCILMKYWEYQRTTYKNLDEKKFSKNIKVYTAFVSNAHKEERFNVFYMDRDDDPTSMSDSKFKKKFGEDLYNEIRQASLCQKYKIARMREWINAPSVKTNHMGHQI